MMRDKRPGRPVPRDGEPGDRQPRQEMPADQAGLRLLRRLSRRPVWSAAVAAAFLAGAAVGPVAASAAADHPAATGQSAAATSGGQFRHLDHIFVIMMENTSYAGLLSPGNADTAYIRSLAGTYGLANNYYGVTHVSMPNYIAATSGSTWGSNSDDESQAPLFNHENLVDQFTAGHVSWKGYMQSLPYAGDTVDKSADGLYVRKHDPFLLYPDVYSNQARTRNVVPLTQLKTDLATGQVPQFAWISPNVCDDMHGGVSSCPYPSSPQDPAQATLYSDGNTFLKTWVTRIMHSSAWTGNSAIFVTWDEGSYADTAPYGPQDLRGGPDSPILPATPVNPASGSGGDLVGGTVYGGGHVPMIVIARGVGHRVDSTLADHYSLLRTIEENFALPLLGNAGDSVQVHSLAPLLQPARSQS